jgi:D-methionine transport system substrate-binding protein
MNKWLTFSFAALAAVFLISCGSHSDAKRLKVGATAVPHAEILEQILPEMKQRGVDMDIIIVEDYNIPNRALADGDLDANFFQHTEFMELQEREFGYQFETLAKVHIEPMGLYSLRIKSLSDLKDGATIAIPSDPTNQARALFLLEKNGLITLNRHDIGTSLLNVKNNPKNFHFLEVDPHLLSRTLGDVDLAAITMNFALQGDLSPQRDALALESGESPFVNIIAIRKGESGRPELQALKEAISSEKVGKFIDQRYQGAIIKVRD